LKKLEEIRDRGRKIEGEISNVEEGIGRSKGELGGLEELVGKIRVGRKAKGRDAVMMLTNSLLDS
jgi:hypothetical protein